MRFLVTGASGFTGAYLVAELQARGLDAIPLEADITHPRTLAEAVAEARPDRVIHLAALAFAGSDDFAPFYQVNQIGTFNLLDAVSRTAPDAHVLIASSANIYGNAREGYLDETTPPQPVNHYGVSKWAMEVGAQLWRNRVRMTVTRPFNYTGVGQGEQYLIPKIVAHFRRREPVIRLGNIDVKRDFGDVRSVAAAYADLSATPADAPVINVATGSVWSIREVIDAMTAMTGHRIEIEIDPALVRVNEVKILAGDPALLRAILPHWKPRQLEDTLRWMLAG
jgi:nucleoside-diphosphate-sugar epimerase